MLDVDTLPCLLLSATLACLLSEDDDRYCPPDSSISISRGSKPMRSGTFPPVYFL
jgi:hypothetical protein